MTSLSRRWGMLMLVGAALSNVAAVEAQCGPVSESTPVTFFGNSFDDGTALHWNSQNLYDAEAQVGKPVRYFRARLKLAEGGAWITIRDADYHVLQVIPPGTSGRPESIWTHRLYEPRVFFEVVDRSGRTGSLGTIEEVVVVPEESEFPYYSVKSPGHPEWRPLYTPSVPARIKRLGDHVGLLFLHYGRAFWSCSGAVVGRNLFLTNWHCGGIRLSANVADSVPFSAFWSRVICESAVVDLSWDDDNRSREFRCDDVLFTSRELDVAIISLAPVQDESKLVGAAVGAAPRDNENLSMIHHPSGLPKQTNSQDCSVVSGRYRLGTQGTFDFSHDCDSEAGSSGSPLFNGRGEVVGVHHLGFRRDPGRNCEVVERVNRAVRIDELSAELQRQLEDAGTSPEQRDAIDEIMRQFGWTEVNPSGAENPDDD